MISAVRIEDYAALALRPFLRGSVGRKRVNQDLFASLCDARFMTPDDVKRGVPKGTRSIYVRSDLLDDRILNALPESVKILVSGNSDRDFVEPLKLPAWIDCVYLQNLCYKSKLSHVLPIGIENLGLAKAGLPHLYLNRAKPKFRQILVGPFGMTHPERKELLEMAAGENPNVTTLQKRITAWEYSRLSQQYAFIACPRGNGIDTHRFWETLYRGSVPVVKRSAWTEMIEELGLPIVQLDSWEEIHQLNLEEEFSKHLDNPRQALSPDYWRSVIGLH